MSDMPAPIMHAMHETIAREVAKGGVAHTGQFGSIVIQFADHYVECAQGTCLINPGEWRAIPVFSNSGPDRPGNGIGEWGYSADLRSKFVWNGERWIQLRGSSE